MGKTTDFTAQVHITVCGIPVGSRTVHVSPDSIIGRLLSGDMPGAAAKVERLIEALNELPGVEAGSKIEVGGVRQEKTSAGG